MTFGSMDDHPAHGTATPCVCSFGGNEAVGVPLFLLPCGHRGCSKCVPYRREASMLKEVRYFCMGRQCYVLLKSFAG